VTADGLQGAWPAPAAPSSRVAGDDDGDDDVNGDGDAHDKNGDDVAVVIVAAVDDDGIVPAKKDVAAAVVAAAATAGERPLDMDVKEEKEQELPSGVECVDDAVLDSPLGQKSEPGESNDLADEVVNRSSIAGTSMAVSLALDAGGVSIPSVGEEELGHACTAKEMEIAALTDDAGSARRGVTSEPLTEFAAATSEAEAQEQDQSQSADVEEEH